MRRNPAIVINVSPELKSALEYAARCAGVTLAHYVRSMLGDPYEIRRGSQWAERSVAMLYEDIGPPPAHGGDYLDGVTYLDSKDIDPLRTRPLARVNEQEELRRLRAYAAAYPDPTRAEKLEELRSEALQRDLDRKELEHQGLLAMLLERPVKVVEAPAPRTAPVSTWHQEKIRELKSTIVKLRRENHSLKQRIERLKSKRADLGELDRLREELRQTRSDLRQVDRDDKVYRMQIISEAHRDLSLRLTQINASRTAIHQHAKQLESMLDKLGIKHNPTPPLY